MIITERIISSGMNYFEMRKEINKVIKRQSLILCGLLILSVAPLVPGQSRRSHIKNVFLPYTKNLPPVDRVKIIKLYSAQRESDDRSRNGQVLADKILPAAGARRIASIWRKLKYRPGVSACHEPAYAVEFYSKGRLLVNASVCWACSNIFFHVPKLFKTSGYENTQNFDADSRLGARLYEIFQNAFAASEKDSSK